LGNLGSKYQGTHTMHILEKPFQFHCSSCSHFIPESVSSSQAGIAVLINCGTLFVCCWFR
jgi:hypothetical protein